MAIVIKRQETITQHQVQKLCDDLQESNELPSGTLLLLFPLLHLLQHFHHLVLLHGLRIAWPPARIDELTSRSVLHP